MSSPLAIALAHLALAKDLITHLLCVDPAQRFSIDEFLKHPWCSAAPAPPPPPTPGVYGHSASFDSPLLFSARGGREARSPGLASLKEAFDITYAVHRMEEEGARRRAQKGGANRGFLSGLDEEEETDMEEEDLLVEDARRRYGDRVSQELSKELEELKHRGAGPAGPSTQVQQAQQMPAGSGSRVAAKRAVHGGHHNQGAFAPSSTIYDGRAGQRDRGRRSGVPFDLDLGGATILGRRHKHEIDERGISPVTRVTEVTVNPGSPMRVD